MFSLLRSDTGCISDSSSVQLSGLCNVNHVICALTAPCVVVNSIQEVPSNSRTKSDGRQKKTQMLLLKETRVRGFTVFNWII